MQMCVPSEALCDSMRSVQSAVAEVSGTFRSGCGFPPQGAKAIRRLGVHHTDALSACWGTPQGGHTVGASLSRVGCAAWLSASGWVTASTAFGASS